MGTVLDGVGNQNGRPRCRRAGVMTAGPSGEQEVAMAYMLLCDVAGRHVPAAQGEEPPLIDLLAGATTCRYCGPGRSRDRLADRRR